MVSSVRGGFGPSHQAGMSRLNASELWHELSVEERFATPLVQKSYEGLPLPVEKHELPSGVDDPFEAQHDKLKEILDEQEHRLLAGAQFLHGKPPPHAEPDDVTRALECGVACGVQRPGQPQWQADATRAEHDYLARLEELASQPVPVPQTSTTTAGQREALHKDVAQAAALAAALGPVAAGQTITTVVEGPLPALASPVVHATGAVVTATEVAGVGIAEALDEGSAVVPRRGLRTKA